MVNVSKWARDEWKGKWIWIPQAKSNDQAKSLQPFHNCVNKDEMNQFVLFRRSFSISQPVKKADIFISIDSRYRLYINGEFIGKGIHRCESFLWYYDTYDITNHLREGENVIAFEARFYGRELAFYQPPLNLGGISSNAGKGGLIFDIVIEKPDGTTIIIGSDELTKSIVDASQDSNAPHKGGLGYTEIVDFSKKVPGWNNINFDDKEWQASEVKGYPISTLVSDPNQNVKETEEYASEILLMGIVEDCNVDFDEEERKTIDFVIQNTLDYKTKLPTDSVIINSEGLTGSGICQINPPGEGKAISIMLRYDSMMVGYNQLVIEGGKGTIVDIINVEKIYGEDIDMNPHDNKRGWRVMLSGGMDSFVQWEYEGFLYQQIKIRNISQPVKIHKLNSLRTSMLPETYGKFECSDKDLTELWNTSAFTLLCCATDAYMDCPQREQRAYIGDAYVEALVSQVCFGSHGLTKKIIYDAALGQRSDGMTYSYHPGDYTANTHIIPDYCLYWIQLTDLYHQWTGENEILFDMYPHFLLAIDWFLKFLDKKVGLIGHLPHWIFIDWGYNQQKEAFIAIINAQFVDCLRIVANIAKISEDRYHERKYLEIADSIKEKINQLCWEPSLGCYRDGTDGEKPTGLISQHTNAYLALKKIASDSQERMILQNVFLNADPQMEKEQINKNRPKRNPVPKDVDVNKHIVYAQPFFMHYVHAFLDVHNQHDIIHRYFKRGWMPMLREGKTKTLWETWSDKQSECHAWSGTPAYDLSTYWLGVRQTSPKFRDVLIKPNLYGMNWAKGTYPTPMGDIIVKWESNVQNDSNIVEFEVSIPEKIQSAKFSIPRYEGQIPKEIYYSRKEYIPIANIIELTNGKNIIKLKY